MARAGIKDLRDDEIIRFLRFNVSESAPSTFTQQSFDTQLSIDRGLIWMIAWIEYTLALQDIDDPAQDAMEILSMHVARESKTSILGLHDADCIFRASIVKDRFATIGTEAGPVVNVDQYPRMRVFPIPLPYAAQDIHIGILGSAAAAKTVTGRIAYILRRVSDKFFYRVAQTLIS